MKKPVVIFGNGKMAQLAHFYFNHDSEYEPVAFTVDAAFIGEERQYLGLPLIPFDEVEARYSPQTFLMFVAVGYTRLNTVRTTCFLKAKAKGYRFASYLSSRSSHWGDVVMGDNCFILENQVIQPFVKFGDNVFVWGGCLFGHDVVVEDHCYLAAHIVVSGGVRIGTGSFIGINATLRDNVTIGEKCIIGAGALILRSTKPKEVYIAKSTELYALDSDRFERMMEISK